MSHNPYPLWVEPGPDPHHPSIHVVLGGEVVVLTPGQAVDLIESIQAALANAVAAWDQAQDDGPEAS